MAEGEGFEPPLPVRVKRFSRPPVSTTHTSLRERRCSLMIATRLANAKKGLRRRSFGTKNLGLHAGTIVGCSNSHSGTYFLAFRHPLTLIWDDPIILARSLSGAFSSTFGLGPSRLVLYLLRFTSIGRSYESALSRGKGPNYARLHPST